VYPLFYLYWIFFDYLHGVSYSCLQRSGLAAGVGLEFRPPVPLLIKIVYRPKIS
jgi:hypothetical protein